MDLWRISKHFESGRISGAVLGLAEALNFGPGSSYFVRLQIIDILPEFYTMASVDSPWRMTHRMCHVGKTSYWMESKTRCLKTGTMLMDHLAQVVRVDTTTRRSAPLPLEGIAPFKKAATMQSPPRFHFPNTLPDQKRTFTYSLKTLPSHEDRNQHVNQSMYVMFCMDCASLAAAKGGILQKFTKDMAYYNTRKFTAEYVSEMVGGVAIDVTCWEDASDPSVLYFVIKVGDRITFRCVGEWYTNPDGSLVTYTKKFVPEIAISKL